MALRTSKLSKNCALRGLVGPFRRAARAEKGPPGLQGGGGGRLSPPPPPLATCLSVVNETFDYFLLKIALHNVNKGLLQNKKMERGFTKFSEMSTWRRIGCEI